MSRVKRLQRLSMIEWLRPILGIRILRILHNPILYHQFSKFENLSKLLDKNRGRAVDHFNLLAWMVVWAFPNIGVALNHHPFEIFEIGIFHEINHLVWGTFQETPIYHFSPTCWDPRGPRCRKRRDVSDVLLPILPWNWSNQCGVSQKKVIHGTRDTETWKCAAAVWCSHMFTMFFLVSIHPKALKTVEQLKSVEIRDFPPKWIDDA